MEGELIAPRPVYLRAKPRPAPLVRSLAAPIDFDPHEVAARVLTPGALNILAALEARLGARRRDLLAAREARQARLDAGERPDFLPETAAIRASDWCVAPLPPDLRDRRVEITGPVDRKMVVNALNSGAQVFMADFEDASSPTWTNALSGQATLMDAVRRRLSFETAGKRYELSSKTATLMVRPRGLHLEERHARLAGRPMSASLFDFGLFLYHNAHELRSRGSGPYFYLPKLESHLEARWWNDVFVEAQHLLGLPQGTIRATVLIETIVAAFEMDEILYELREHSAGLNCGRWDYIFSYVKKFRAHEWAVLPDRAQVGMTAPLMRTYSRLLIRTCHRRGASAIGGMSAFIPVKDNPEANDRASLQVRADKEREATDGHDGSWVAHPGMVSLVREVFDRLMPEPNQIESGKQRDFSATADDLLTPPVGSVTAQGVRVNVAVGLQYLTAWLEGRGAVPIHHLMEDAATAEICRAQLWQWIRHGTKTDHGEVVTAELVRELITLDTDVLTLAQPNREPTIRQAATLLERLVTADVFEEFLTIPGYQILS